MSVSGNTRAVEAAGLRSLLHRLTTFKVTRWVAGGSTSAEVEHTDREETELDKADVVSSLRPDGRHTVVLDIDHPAWLVKSTTPGHYHLYIDVTQPNGTAGINWADYSYLLHALGRAGVIEDGYVNASLQRGHTDVRLPWVKKPEAGEPPAPVGTAPIDADPWASWEKDPGF